jgi:hypothetical protein
MKTRALLLLIGAGGIAAAAILHAPQAHADTATDQFLQDAHSIGFTANSDQHLIGVGYQVCSAMAAGNTASDIAEIIYINTDWTVSLQDAQLFTLTAITDLCPQQGLNAVRRGQALL